ncbi:MAG: Asp-tRNA(Asn)/Glu-tRNA(Gln) amidotransferase subunit GatA [Patescibacteria group bacterium]
MANLNSLTIAQAKEKLKKKEISSTELTKACLDRIKKLQEKLNVFVTITEKEALDRARKADEELKNGSDLPLLGIPIAVKDNFCTMGVRTTASSKVLDDFIPPYESTVTQKLKNAGMVMLGKTNMDAWAHGSSTETSDYGPTLNPWNTKHLPGGSSGGSAAATAADMSIGSIGSETAGSIRQPASWCGVIGLKPTYGRVSRYGVVAMGSSLDSPGPITKSVEDAALILEIIAGHDPMDATTSSLPVPKYTTSIGKSDKKLRIGISKNYLEGVDNKVIKVFEDTKKLFEKLGHTFVELELFNPKYAIDVYTILQRSEVSSNLARYDGIRYGNDRSFFGEEAKRRIMLGTFTLSSGYYDAYYKKAQKVRTIIIKDFDEAFKKVDFILAPTGPTPALVLGASEGQSMFGELADVLVEPSSIAGLTGINLPAGFSNDGLPIGMQLIGPQFSEPGIISIGYEFEKETEFLRERKPNL